VTLARDVLKNVGVIDETLQASVSPVTAIVDAAKVMPPTNIPSSL
jgi:hypothetical protein